MLCFVNVHSLRTIVSNQNMAQHSMQLDSRHQTNKIHRFVPYLPYYNITLNTATCFSPQGTIIMESNQSTTAKDQISHSRTKEMWRQRVQYGHAPHNDVPFNDGPHIRRWSHNIIILTIVLQLPTVFSTETCCTGF